MTSPMPQCPCYSAGPSRGPIGESHRRPRGRSQYFIQVKPHVSLMEYPPDPFFGQVAVPLRRMIKAYCAETSGYLTFDTTLRAPGLGVGCH